MDDEEDDLTNDQENKSSNKENKKKKKSTKPEKAEEASEEKISNDDAGMWLCCLEFPICFLKTNFHCWTIYLSIHSFLEILHLRFTT